MANNRMESSGKYLRRSKRLNLAAIACTQELENQRNLMRVSERGSNPSPQEFNTRTEHSTPPIAHTERSTPCSIVRIERSPSHDSIEEGERPKKKTVPPRGPTRMQSLSLTPSERIDVEFNDRGQPIGFKSVFLSSYLGTLGRDVVPFSFNDWRKVSQTYKDDLWACVKERFNLDDMYRKLFMMTIGNRWKEHKSRLVTAIKDASISSNKEAKYAMLKPDNMRDDEWNIFLKDKLSEEFEVKSNKFKKIRSQNKIPYCKSRKGYARLEDEMKKKSPLPSAIRREDVWCEAHIKKNGEVPNAYVADCMAQIQQFKSTQSSSQTLSIKDDALSQILGPERNGRVRAMGFGITPSQMSVHTHQSKRIHELENHVSGLTAKLDHLTNLFMQTISARGDGNEKVMSPRDYTPQSQHGSTNFNVSTNLRAGDAPKKCKLLNWQRNAVAEGTLSSTDPNALVHHVTLGKDNWKVWVDVALDPTAQLWKPTSEMSIIQDVVGTTVAWNKDFISLD